MTLENLVVYGGFVLGLWLTVILTLLAVGHRHRTVLRLDAGRGHRRLGRRRYTAPGPTPSSSPSFAATRRKAGVPEPRAHPGPGIG